MELDEVWKNIFISFSDNRADIMTIAKSSVAVRVRENHIKVEREGGIWVTQSGRQVVAYDTGLAEVSTQAYATGR